jgi:antirestriction protein
MSVDYGAPYRAHLRFDRAQEAHDSRFPPEAPDGPQCEDCGDEGCPSCDVGLLVEPACPVCHDAYPACPECDGDYYRDAALDR